MKKKNFELFFPKKEADRFAKYMLATRNLKKEYTSSKFVSEMNNINTEIIKFIRNAASKKECLEIQHFYWVCYIQHSNLEVVEFIWNWYMRCNELKAEIESMISSKERNMIIETLITECIFLYLFKKILRNIPKRIAEGSDRLNKITKEKYDDLICEIERAKKI